MADPNEMRHQARALRREAGEFDQVAATLRATAATDAMVGPAAERLRERLVERAGALDSIVIDVTNMAVTLDRSADQVEAEQRRNFGA